MKIVKFTAVFTLYLAGTSALAMTCSSSIETVNNWGDVSRLCDNFVEDSEHSVFFVDIDGVIINSFYRLVDEKIPEIIQLLREKPNCDVVALTSRVDTFADKTRENTSKVGVQFSNDFFKKDGIILSNECLFEAEWSCVRKRSAYKIDQAGGIVYTSVDKENFPSDISLDEFSFFGYEYGYWFDISNSPKGVVMKHMIDNCLIERPDRIVFVDDNKGNVESVFSSCCELNIPVLSIYFCTKEQQTIDETIYAE
ncbi:MAG: DUF2608 domain-containing protein [Holosporaceae bacterium]|jgi:hypothetical protein|nr:DUF2608 domain-containing protein [Holosporaceae bacterium]